MCIVFGMSEHWICHALVLKERTASRSPQRVLRGSARTILTLSLAANPPYYLRRLLEWDT